MRILSLIALFISLTVTSAAQNCSVSVSYVVTGNTVVATATPTNTQYPLFSWFDPATGNFTSPSPSPSFTFTFPPNGIVYSCVWMDDSLAQCSDSACFYAYLPVCNASFYTFDSLSTTFFVNTSQVDSGSYFQWDFGDGNYSYDADPAYTYGSPGTYTACVYIWDPAFPFPCDTFCTQVIVTYTAPNTSVNEFGTLPGGVSVFPNPSSDNISVNWTQSAAGSSTITITDLTGRIISSVPTISTTAGRQTVSLPVNQLPGGVYLLKIETEKGKQAVTRLFVSPH
ncbi:MAG: T9SS type A sorting domain-containing protein [Bacteroidia bacterium]